MLTGAIVGAVAGVVAVLVRAAVLKRRKTKSDAAQAD